MQNTNTLNYERAEEIYIIILEKMMRGEIVPNSLVEEYANLMKIKRFHQLYDSIKDQMDTYVNYLEDNDEYVKPENWDSILTLNYEKIMNRKPSLVFPDEESELDFIKKYNGDLDENSDSKTYTKSKKSK